MSAETNHTPPPEESEVPVTQAHIGWSVIWKNVLEWGAIGAGASGAVLGIGALVIATPIAPGQGTVLGGLGVLAAAGVTFYASHRNRVSNERIEESKARQAENELKRSQENFATQYSFDTEKAASDQRATTARELRARFTAAASQLADAASTIKLAGVYSLIALADDWFAEGHSDEREVCIALLLSYLRAPQVDPNPDDESAQPYLHVRATIVRQVGRRVSAEEDPAKNWQSIGTVTFARTDLRYIDLRGAALTGCNFSHAIMDGCRLADAKMAGCRLYFAGLVDANLQRTKLTSANLRGARFTGANLRGASLSKSQGRMSFFTGADLTGVSFNGGDFSRAQFREAELDGADLKGANLTRARGLDTASMKDVEYDAATRWPESFVPPTSL